MGVRGQSIEEQKVARYREPSMEVHRLPFVFMKPPKYLPKEIFTSGAGEMVIIRCGRGQEGAGSKNGDRWGCISGASWRSGLGEASGVYGGSLS